jgi:hypothetical protein
MRNSKTLMGVTMLWLVSVAAPAAANRVEIEYAITSGEATADGSFLAEVVGNTFALSYLVNVTSGAPNLESCATTNVIPGYVIQEGGTLLLSLDAAFTSTYTYFNTAGRVVAPTGPLNPSSCPVDGVARLDGATASITMPGTQTVTCIGSAPYCGDFDYTPNVPVVLDMEFRLSGGFVWNKANGTGMMQGLYQTQSVSGGVYSATATVTFVGQEIAMSRTFAPEPNALLIGITSLATIGGLARSRRGTSVWPSAQES